MARRMLGMSTPVRAALRERAIISAPAGESSLPDVTTWSFVSVTIFEDVSITGLVYNDDGTKIYVVANNGTSTGKILSNTPDLSPPYVPVADTTPLPNVLVSQRAAERIREMAWSSDGTKVYSAELAAGQIAELINTGTPYNPGAGEITEVGGDTFNATGDPLNIYVRADGAEIYYINNVNGNLYQITMSTADDLTTAAMGDTYDPSEVAIPVGLVFGGSGETLYILGLDSVIYEYSLSAAWDITSATYTTRSKDISGDMPIGTTAWGLAVSPDATKLIVALAHGVANQNKIMYFTS